MSCSFDGGHVNKSQHSSELLQRSWGRQGTYGHVPAEIQHCMRYDELKLYLVVPFCGCEPVTEAYNWHKEELAVALVYLGPARTTKQKLITLSYLVCYRKPQITANLERVNISDAPLVCALVRHLETCARVRKVNKNNIYKSNYYDNLQRNILTYPVMQAFFYQKFLLCSVWASLYTLSHAYTRYTISVHIYILVTHLI